MKKILVFFVSAFFLSACNFLQSGSNISTDQQMEAAIGESKKYQIYTPEKIKNMEGKPYALFFHASWCPPCRKIENDIIENIETLPENTTVFKVDFDTEKDLGKKYKVASQHTAIFFNKDGNHVKTFRGFGIKELHKFFQ